MPQQYLMISKEVMTTMETTKSVMMSLYKHAFHLHFQMKHMVKLLLFKIMFQSGVEFTVPVMFGMDMFITKKMKHIICFIQIVSIHGAGNLQIPYRMERILWHMKVDYHAHQNLFLICRRQPTTMEHKTWQHGLVIITNGLRQFGHQQKWLHKVIQQTTVLRLLFLLQIVLLFLWLVKLMVR